MGNTAGKSGLREYLEALGVALILALIIRSFVVQAFTIPSGSMLQTLQIGDYLLVNKFAYGVRFPFSVKETNPDATSMLSRYSVVQGGEMLSIGDPEREDIVVFEYPRNPSVHYIKRVIGIPGDTIEIRNKVLYRNGRKVDEPYVQHTKVMPGPGDNYGPVIVPTGKYLMLGDNRDESYDSRFWGFVDRDAIVGNALIIYWSMDGARSIRWNRLGMFVQQ